MSVNLKKGDRVDLKKHTGENLKNVMVGLGWDEVDRKKVPGGLFGLFSGHVHDIDCDASAFLCKGGKIRNNEDVIYFGNLLHKSDAVRHMGDNLTGAGEGDDEQIFINLNILPSDYDRIIFVVNIYKASERNQDFGMIDNAFIRICDADNDNEIYKYNLSENYSGKTAMIFGELILQDGRWKFNAIGEATDDKSIKELVKRFA